MFVNVPTIREIPRGPTFVKKGGKKENTKRGVVILFKKVVSMFSTRFIKYHCGVRFK